MNGYDAAASMSTLSGVDDSRKRLVRCL